MIRLEQISFSYENQSCILQNIDLNIAKGEFVLLLGESGSGKTTLSRVINGLVPKFYNGDFSGEVFIDGQDMNKLSMVDLSVKVGSVFQNPRTQFFTLDTTSELAFSLENQGIPSEEIAYRVERAFEELNIEHLRDRDLQRLSGGQMQAIAIAGVYALDPPIFVFDEPSANLDSESTEELFRLLKRLKAAGKTIVISEHRIRYLSSLVDRAFYIKGGQIAEEWSGEDFRCLDEHRRIALGLRTFQPPNLQLKNRPFPVENNYLQLKDLTVGYKKKLLCGVNVTIKSGEVIGLIGENGAGKTCFLNTLSGLIKAQSGQIIFNGKNLSARARQKKCALVMQDPAYQFFMESVEAELFMGRKQESAESVFGILKKMNLLDKRSLDPLKISGGEKQRLAVGISLMDEKEIFLFDEPSSGLDYKNMKNLAQNIIELQRRGKIILFISHDYELLSEVCTRILIVEKGKFLWKTN